LLPVDSLPATIDTAATVLPPGAQPHSLLDGEVTFAFGPPWDAFLDDSTLVGLSNDIGKNKNFRLGRVMIAADPGPIETGCENGPAPADAEALARSIMADPNFETTETAPVPIAGIDGLQIDGVVTNQSNTNWALCYPMWQTDALFRMRLYLIDYPGESAQILTIAVIAPETDFERVLEEATPIVESLEIHTA
jgi:hypothetical protein